MNIFVSTTYFGKKNSELNKVLNQLKTANIDGIEIGSTHKYQTKKYFQKIIKGNKPKRILLHNFFPPSKEEDFVINIASNNKLIRKKSIDLIINNIDFSKKVNSELYTFHPGFVSDGKIQANYERKNYDFNFSNNLTNKNLAFELMLNSLKKIIKYAKFKKMKIAIETEGSVKKSNYLMMQRPIEYEKLFKTYPENLFINFNISHSYFASKVFKFSLSNFIKKIKKKVVAVELSCNDGINDNHSAISNHSRNLKYLKYFYDIPIILEFRNTSFDKLKNSIIILKKNLYK